MKKGLLFFVTIALLASDLCAQKLVLDSTKLQGYLEYMDLKEKEILAVKEEREGIQKKKNEDDSLLKYDRVELIKLQDNQKKMKLQVAQTLTAISKNKREISLIYWVLLLILLVLGAIYLTIALYKFCQNRSTKILRKN